MMAIFTGYGSRTFEKGEAPGTWRPGGERRC
jgi:hypothetical protein